jgi:hypothetical protein
LLATLQPVVFPVPRGAQYVLEEDDNAGFTTPVVVYSGAAVSAAIFAPAVGTFYYRVKATNQAGETGWSNTQSVLVTIEPPACPQNGSWAGTTNQGYAISFTVSSSPSCRLDTLRITYRVTCVPSNVIAIKTVTFSTWESVSSNHFDTLLGDPRVIGEFGTPLSATGTWSSSYFDTSFGASSGSGTWTSGYTP